MTITQALHLYGPDALTFLVPMRPIRMVLFVAYTSSADEEVMVPANIISDRYSPFENYKIEVLSIYPGFGKESFYVSDLDSMIKDGRVKMLIDSSKSREFEMTQTLSRLVCGVKGKDWMNVEYYDGIIDDAESEAEKIFEKQS